MLQRVRSSGPQNRSFDQREFVADLTQSIPDNVAAFLTTLNQEVPSEIVLHIEAPEGIQTVQATFYPLKKETDGKLTPVDGSKRRFEIIGRLASDFAETFAVKTLKTSKVCLLDSQYALICGEMPSDEGEIEDPRTIELEDCLVNFLMSLSQDFPALLLEQGFPAYRFDPNPELGANLLNNMFDSVATYFQSGKEGQITRITDLAATLREATDQSTEHHIPPKLVENFTSLFQQGYGLIKLMGTWDGSRRDLGTLTRLFS